MRENEEEISGVSEKVTGKGAIKKRPLKDIRNDTKSTSPNYRPLKYEDSLPQP